MTSLDVLDHAAAARFRPFRVKLMDGRTFDIPCPDAIHVGWTRLSISTVLARLPDIRQAHLTIPLNLVEGIEPLDFLHSS